MEDEDDSIILDNPKLDNSNNSNFQKLIIEIKSNFIFLLLNLLLTIACLVVYILTTYYPNLILRNAKAYLIS